MKPAWEDRIEARADVLPGKLVIKGTRLAVDFIVGLLAQGWTEAQILENYPGVSSEDLRACLSYAADLPAPRRHPPRGKDRGYRRQPPTATRAPTPSTSAPAKKSP